MKSKIYKIDSKKFLEIVNSSNTFTEIIKRCGLENKGGNINTVKRRIKKENINIPHIKTGRDHNSGKIYLQQRISKECALNKIFIENSYTSKNTVKKLIKRYNLKKYICSECNLTNNWNDKPLSLQLDHINGINNDNRVENLRWMCPNCHSQTETYCGKSSRKKYNCNICSKETTGCGKICRECHSLNLRKVERPSKEILELEIKENSMVSLGKKYKVSDNTIRKWCKYYKIV